MATATIPTRQALRQLRRLCGLLPPTRQVSTRCARSLLAASRPRLELYANTPLRTRTVTTSRVQEAPTAGAATGAAPQATSLPDPTTYYTLFPDTLPEGPPPSAPFAVPLRQLRREFLQLQARHHPDKYASTPAHSKAVALSALLNSAYRTLADPLLRARYLLQLSHGVDITSEDSSVHAGVTDQATLGVVMEAQEAIEEARDQADIDALRRLNDTRIAETEERLARAFEDADVAACKTETVSLNYWRNIKQGLDEWEPGKEVRLIH